ncbi:hypothetical protein K8O92_16150 [Nocardia asteroides]|nr:hypothetical protein K8O92_16150 [Nocardia asteroides]
MDVEAIKGRARNAPPVSRLVLDHHSPQSFGEIRSWVEKNAMDRDVIPSSPGGRILVDERAWGEGMRMMSDSLRQRGVNGKAYDVAMGDWADQLFLQARAGGYRVPYDPEDREHLFAWPPLYRGDNRLEDTIFEQGFEPKGDNTDLRDHQLSDDVDDSNYVATSRSAEYAALHTGGAHGAEEGGAVYLITDARGGTDVEVWNQQHGEGANIAFEDEIAFKPNIPPDKIEGRLLDPNDPHGGILPNPNFTPNYSPKQGIRDDGP